MSNDIRKFVKGVGITPTTSSPINEKGELRVNDSDGKLRYHNGTNESAVVTESHAATLTNKTIDGDDNTLQDISLSSLKVEAGDANKVIRRDASGSVISGNDLPNSSPILTTDATQTITNKTIDGDDNTIQDVALTSLKQVVADANKVIRRDSSGVVISGNDLPNTSPIVTTDATQTLTNKTIDGDDNTVQDLALTSLKTVVADANKVLRRDASGDVISGNDLPNSSPILTTDAAQTITNKTIDGDDNTLQDIDLPSLKTIATDADKVIRRDSSGAVISGNTLPNSSPIVTTDATQVLTNKDIDGGTASNSRRITLPQDTYTNINALTRKEGTILYANDTDKVYIDDGTNLKEIGSGGGDLNFLQLSNKAYDAESGTAGWSTYKDAAQARPVDGTGGSPSVVSAISTTTTNPLSGTRSFLLAKGSGNAQGEGWSVDFQIDRAHFARVLQIEFDYQVESGTFVAGNTIDYTTAGDSDLIVYIYDIDNNQLIEPTTFRLYSNASNIADKFVGNFQTSANGVNYRLIFHVARTSTAAWTLKVDNIVVKPAKYTYGTPITDWQEYTPTFNSGFTVGTGGNAYSKWYWRRVGGDCEIRGSFTLGTTGFSMGSGNFTFTLPPGLALDEYRFNGYGSGVNGSNSGRAGSAHIFDSAGTGDREVYVVVRVGSSLTTFVVAGRTDTGAQAGVNATFPFTWGAGDFLAVYGFSVPIAGWSSSVKISEPMELRDVVFRVEGQNSPASQSIPADTIAKVQGHWYPPAIDTCNGWNPSTAQYTIPVSGYYVVSATILAVRNVADNVVDVYIYKNDSEIAVDLDRPVATSTSNGQQIKLFFHPRTFYFNAGDRIDVRVRPRGFTLNEVGGWGHTSFNIYRLPSSQALAQSESVFVKAYNMSGPTIPNDAGANVGNWTKSLDTHNCFNASNGQFTAPYPGLYKFDIQGLTTSAISQGLTGWGTTIVSGSGITGLSHISPNSGSYTYAGIVSSFTVYAERAGTVFQVRCFGFGIGGTRNYRATANDDLTLSIFKIS